MSDREKMYFEDDKIDWAIAEMLSYGSILNESYNVRISGQDVERGTFSHRHAILKDEESEENFIPLNHLNKFQGNFEIYNSHCQNMELWVLNMVMLYLILIL